MEGIENWDFLRTTSRARKVFIAFSVSPVSCFIEHSRCAVRSHQHYLCPLPTYQKSGCAPFEIDFLTLRDMVCMKCGLHHR